MYMCYQQNKIFNMSNINHGNCISVSYHNIVILLNFFYVSANCWRICMNLICFCDFTKLICLYLGLSSTMVTFILHFLNLLKCHFLIQVILYHGNGLSILVIFAENPKNHLYNKLPTLMASHNYFMFWQIQMRFHE